MNQTPKEQGNNLTRELDLVKQENNKLRVIALLVGICGLAIMCVLIFVVYSLLRVTPEIQDKVVPSTPSPTSSQNQKNTKNTSIPENWRTYSNTKHGFSFSYAPSFIYVKEDTNGDGVYIATSSGDPIELSPISDLWISAYATTLDDAGYDYWSKEIATMRNTKVDGVFDAIVGEIPQKDNTQASYGYSMEILKDRVIYRISLSAISQKRGNSSMTKELFDQIVSTFTFKGDNLTGVWSNKVINSQSEGNYSSFKIFFPINWEINVDKSLDFMQEIKLTKDTITLTILQAPMGGSSCIYPGESPPEGPSSINDSFIEIQRKDATEWRLSLRGDIYTVCQRNRGEKYFGSITKIGTISVQNSGSKYDTKSLDEIKQILEMIETVN